MERHLRPDAIPTLVAAPRVALVAAILAAGLPAAAAAHPARYRHAHSRPRHHHRPPPPAAVVEEEAREPVVAHRSPFPYLYVGAGPEATRLHDRRAFPDVERGGLGVTVFGGVRFGRVVGLELGWLAARHDGQDGHIAPTDATLQAVTLDLKLHVPVEGPVVPYVQGGLGSFTFYDEVRRYAITGGGWQLGAGLDLELGRHVAVGGRVLYRTGLLDNDHADRPVLEYATLAAVTGSALLTVRF